ncbi:hypothetical protein [Spiroplasma clarkii]|uniref:hypothetical protein n=1 Tax=Spiroplasma clarkii TaxID=2139 RepID=UPI0011BAC671|nr:hypothetical protein [Spiroplasma clarkii]
MKNTNYYVNDFYRFPIQMQTFMKANGLLDANNKPTADAFKVFNMLNTGAWVGDKIYLNEDRIGTTDFRQLTHLVTQSDDTPYDLTTKVGQEKFYEDYMKGNWKYSGEAINSLSMFASHVPNDLAESKMGDTRTATQDIYSLVYASDYDDILHTGRNKALSDNDTGVSYYPDPELDAQLEEKSSGVGNLISEKTTLVDSNPDFVTNFSTGQGVVFNTQAKDGSISTISNYPWSNTNIADTQPTYKWKVATDAGVQLNKTDGVSGYYDYYNPYLKGNSIALGGGYDTTGKIQEGTFTKDATYNWTIMGADYSSTKREISMVVKGDTDKVNLENLTINVTDQSGEMTKFTPTKTNLANGWVKISAQASSQISQIGLGFTAKAAKLTLNVGEIAVKDSSVRNTPKATTPELTSEYLVARNNQMNLRLNFNHIIDDSIYSYYEIYQKNSDASLTMVGQSNANNYYIKMLQHQFLNFM